MTTTAVTITPVPRPAPAPTTAASASASAPASPWVAASRSLCRLCQTLRRGVRVGAADPDAVVSFDDDPEAPIVPKPAWLMRSEKRKRRKAKLASRRRYKPPQAVYAKVAPGKELMSKKWVKGDLCRFLRTLVGRTPTRWDMKKLRKHYLMHHADPFDVNEDRRAGTNAFMFAAMGGHVQIMELLLLYAPGAGHGDAGSGTFLAKLDEQNLLNECALTIATARKQWHVAEMLLELGANPNLADLEGRSSLFWCATHGTERGALPVAQLLVAKGADQSLWVKQPPPIKIAGRHDDAPMVYALSSTWLAEREAIRKAEEERARAELEAEKERWEKQGHAIRAQEVPATLAERQALRLRRAGERSRKKQAQKLEAIRAERRAQARQKARDHRRLHKAAVAETLKKQLEDKDEMEMGDEVSYEPIGWVRGDTVDAEALQAGDAVEGSVPVEEAYGPSFGPHPFTYDCSPVVVEADGPPASNMRIVDVDAEGEQVDEGDDGAPKCEVEALWSRFQHSARKRPSMVPALSCQGELASTLDHRKWKSALHSMDMRSPRHDMATKLPRTKQQVAVDAGEWGMRLDQGRMKDWVH